MRSFAFCSDSGLASKLATSLRYARAGLVLTLLLAGFRPALALDGDTPSNGQPLKMFNSLDEALRDGLDRLKAGDPKSSVRALTYAADGGQPLAQWQLGRMYASGEGVPKDDIKAFHYYEALVEAYDEDDPNRANSSAVSNAFIAVGLYCLTGIPGSDVKPDSLRAREMFQYAAMNFRDREAQYRLARLYMDGAPGLEKNNKVAAHWLALAAEKRHLPAQAYLGHLLFQGDGVPRQRARGLMWLMIARNGAAPGDAWIRDLYAKDMALAENDDREMARIYVEERTHPVAMARNGGPFGLIDALSPFSRLFSSAPMSAFETNDQPPESGQK